MNICFEGGEVQLRKKLVKLIMWITIPLGSIFLYFTLPWLIIFIGMHLEPNPPRPEITYGEFPFRLEYEINGERMIVEDTLICEYDGVGANEATGKHRKWQESLASGKEKIILLRVNDSKEIYYDPGSARYFMGDMENSDVYNHIYPDALYLERRNKLTANGVVYADELLEKYNIKLIRWDIAPPIKNSFN